MGQFLWGQGSLLISSINHGMMLGRNQVQCYYYRLSSARPLSDAVNTVKGWFVEGKQLVEGGSSSVELN